MLPPERLLEQRRMFHATQPETALAWGIAQQRPSQFFVFPPLSIEGSVTLLDVEVLLRQGKRIQLQAPAGMGKTVLMHRMAKDIILSGILPLWVSLRELHLTQQTPHIWEQACAAFAGDMDQLQSWIEDGKVVLFVDGLDGGEILPSIYAQITALAEAYPRLGMVISGRVLRNFPDISALKLTLMPWESDAIAQLSERWYRIACADAQTAPSLAKAWRQQVWPDRYAFSLCQTPLMAVMMLQYHRANGELPRFRSEIYDFCCQGLIAQGPMMEGVSTKDLSTIYQDLAVWMQELMAKAIPKTPPSPWEPPPPPPMATQSAVVLALIKRLRALPDFSPERAGELAENFIHELCAGSGFFVESPPGMIQPIHERLMGHLAGQQRVRQAQLTGSVPQLLLSHVEDRGWRKILVDAIIATHPSPDDAALLIDALMAANTPATAFVSLMLLHDGLVVSYRVAHQIIQQALRVERSYSDDEHQRVAIILENLCRSKGPYLKVLQKVLTAQWMVCTGEQLADLARLTPAALANDIFQTLLQRKDAETLLPSLLLVSSKHPLSELLYAHLTPEVLCAAQMPTARILPAALSALGGIPSACMALLPLLFDRARLYGEALIKAAAARRQPDGGRPFPAGLHYYSNDKSWKIPVRPAFTAAHSIIRPSKPSVPSNTDSIVVNDGLPSDTGRRPVGHPVDIRSQSWTRKEGERSLRLRLCEFLRHDRDAILLQPLLDPRLWGNRLLWTPAATEDFLEALSGALSLQRLSPQIRPPTILQIDVWLPTEQPPQGPTSLQEDINLFLLRAHASLLPTLTGSGPDWLGLVGMQNALLLWLWSTFKQHAVSPEARALLLGLGLSQYQTLHHWPQSSLWNALISTPTGDSVGEYLRYLCLHVSHPHEPQYLHFAMEELRKIQDPSLYKALNDRPIRLLTLEERMLFDENEGPLR